MPSLFGRRLIDRFKRATGHYLRMPAPPYADPGYWEGVYRQLGPDHVFEWGDFDLKDILTYEYHLLEHGGAGDSSPRSGGGNANDENGVMAKTTTTLADTINVFPYTPPPSSSGDGDGSTFSIHDDSHNNNNNDNPDDNPIMILGCGNSRLGEDMVAAGWGPQQHPIINVDVSSRVIESMTQRCDPPPPPSAHHHGRSVGGGKKMKADVHTDDGLSASAASSLRFIQDDATVLSAFNDNAIAACLDKGLVDALFCTDEHEQCHDVMRSVHRVLRPAGVFVCFSYSYPEFILDSLLGNHRRRHPGTMMTNNRNRSNAMTQQQQQQHHFRHNHHPQQCHDPTTSSSSSSMWQDIEIRDLGHVLLYRFQKWSSATNSRINHNSRPRKQKKRRRQ